MRAKASIRSATLAARSRERKSKRPWLISHEAPLDVSVLLAGIWQQPPDFAKADAWLAGRQVATCALSELGFLRVSTHQKALNADMNASRRLLQAFLEKHNAQFVPADLPALKCSARRSEDLTDLYLAELAASKGMKLATFDTGIKHAAVEVIK
ncbi:MAG TPA: PIN domain-containing protein [Candidatus Acidoferrum sp.]|nr:PIN domain-containing protein [Candidatus Acidoferrum sp.]